MPPGAMSRIRPPGSRCAPSRISPTAGRSISSCPPRPSTGSIPTWAKAARLLRPEGWLALLTTGERYPEPLQGRLRDLWVRYSRPTAEWADQPAWLTALRDTGLFGETVEASHPRALRLPAETVIGVER